MAPTKKQRDTLEKQFEKLKASCGMTGTIEPGSRSAKELEQSLLARLPKGKGRQSVAAIYAYDSYVNSNIRAVFNTGIPEEILLAYSHVANSAIQKSKSGTSDDGDKDDPNRRCLTCIHASGDDFDLEISIVASGYFWIFVYDEFEDEKKGPSEDKVIVKKGGKNFQK